MTTQGSATPDEAIYIELPRSSRPGPNAFVFHTRDNWELFLQELAHMLRGRGETRKVGSQGGYLYVNAKQAFDSELGATRLGGYVGYQGAIVVTDCFYFYGEDYMALWLEYADGMREDRFYLWPNPATPPIAGNWTRPQIDPTRFEIAPNGNILLLPSPESRRRQVHINYPHECGIVKVGLPGWPHILAELTPQLEALAMLNWLMEPDDENPLTVICRSPQPDKGPGQQISRRVADVRRAVETYYRDPQRAVLVRAKDLLWELLYHDDGSEPLKMLPKMRPPYPGFGAQIYRHLTDIHDLLEALLRARPE